MTTKNIIIPSDRMLGIHLGAEAFQRKGLFFDFPEFPKGKEYPIVKKIDTNSQAFKKGLRIGNKIKSLNGYSLYCKDISTIKSDFDYEKRSEKYLNLGIIL